MIVVLSNEKDKHYQYVKQKIEDRGERVVLLDFSNYPTGISIGFEIDRGNHEVYFELSNQRFTSKDIKSVWNRRKAQPIAPRKLNNKNLRQYIERESQFFIDSLPQILPLFWLSSPDAISVASRKAYQLIIAHQVGFKIPETLIGNSRIQTENFIDKFKNEIAVKTLCMPHVPIQNTEDEKNALILYTKHKREKELQPILKNVRNCPTIFQQYIQKEFELRITVVGNQVFSCAIHSQESERTKEDWRRYDIANTPHEEYNLPLEIKTNCIKLVQKLGLAFGCIDMIVTPRGEYIFLEINPNGQWLWIERLTNMPIGESIAKMLIAGKIQ